MGGINLRESFRGLLVDRHSYLGGGSCEEEIVLPPDVDLNGRGHVCHALFHGCAFWTFAGSFNTLRRGGRLGAQGDGKGKTGEERLHNA